MGSFFVLLFLSQILLTTTGGIPYYFNISPQPGFNPNRITGRWHLITWTPPSYICGSYPLTDVTYDITYDAMTGKVLINVRGRYPEFPYGCADYIATLTPYKPGFYRRHAPEVITDADLVITDTDYHNYIVFYGCLPRFQKGCEPIALAFGRRPFDGDVKLIHFINGIMSKKLGMDEKRLRLLGYSPLGTQDCDRLKRKVY